MHLLDEIGDDIVERRTRLIQNGYDVDNTFSGLSCISRRSLVAPVFKLKYEMLTISFLRDKMSLTTMIIKLHSLMT